MRILVAALSAALMLTGCVNIQKAPEFSLKKVSGGELKSSELKGKVVVVDFWATWCVPCKKEIPEYVKLREKLKGLDVEFVGVTFESEGIDKVGPKVEELGITYPVVMGTDEVDVGFGGHLGYPTTFLVDQDWNIHKKFLGNGPTKMAQLEKEITALLNKSKDAPVKVPTTAGN